MRKSLIITAALMVSSLFAGSALADETSRGAEKPSLRADRSDGAKAYADKVRDRNDYQGRVMQKAVHVDRRMAERFRTKGDMVDHGSRGNKTTSQERTTARQNEGKSLIQRTVSDKRADIQERSKKNAAQNNNGNRRAFTVANDRKAGRSHDGPASIVDVMAKKELLKFLGAAGVRINCSQSGTCVEETPM